MSLVLIVMSLVLIVMSLVLIVMAAVVALYMHIDVNVKTVVQWSEKWIVSADFEILLQLFQ